MHRIICEALVKGGSEDSFWKRFLPMVSKEWLAEYNEWTSGSGQEALLISWDFMDGDCGRVNAPSRGEQYQQALRVAITIINSRAMRGQNFGEVLKLAKSVLTERRAALKRPKGPRDQHTRIVELWEELVKAVDKRTSSRPGKLGRNIIICLSVIFFIFVMSGFIINFKGDYHRRSKFPPARF